MIGSMQEELLHLQELAELTAGMEAGGREDSLMAQIIEKERRQKGALRNTWKLLSRCRK